MPAQLTIISWRDIPAQVTAKSGRRVEKRELNPRFQVAIDRAAMIAGLIGTDDYLTAWRRESRACSEDLEREVLSTVQRLEDEYSSDVLQQLADNGGVAGTEEASTQ